MQITCSQDLDSEKGRGVSYTPGEWMNCDSFLYLMILNKLLDSCSVSMSLIGSIAGVLGGVVSVGNSWGQCCTFSLLTHFTSLIHVVLLNIGR